MTFDFPFFKCCSYKLEFWSKGMIRLKLNTFFFARLRHRAVICDKINFNSQNGIVFCEVQIRNSFILIPRDCKIYLFAFYIGLE